MFDITATRPLQMGRHGAVATNHPAATRAGAAILEAGGTAADAAIAISAALGVAEPHMSGLGGDGFFTVHQNGQTLAIDGAGAAPLAASPETFGGALPLAGPLCSTVPGLVGGLGLLHRRFATMGWATLLAPAIRLAREGVPASEVHRRFTHLSFDRLKSGNAGALYLPGGDLPPTGHPIVNSALADTLSHLAGAGPDDFYRGALARRIAADAARIGALITPDDLAANHATERRPLSLSWRGAELVQSPLPSTGFVLMAEAALLGRFDIAALLSSPADLVHVMVEIKKRAFVLRERLARDPEGEAPDFATMLPDAELDAIVAAIRLDQASAVPLQHSGRADGDTTYFAVMDGQGNAVSGIQSINNAFGAAVMLPETGILMNNRLAYFHLDPAHPNALRPGRVVRHTMNAPMLLRDGVPTLCFGTPGADNQVQVNFQALVAHELFGLDPQKVCEMPRWYSDQPGQEANWPHGGQDMLTVEAGFPAGVVESLRARGHAVTEIPHLTGMCSLEIIARRPDGLLLAGSDPRRDGWAAAF